MERGLPGTEPEFYLGDFNSSGANLRAKGLRVDRNDHDLYRLCNCIRRFRAGRCDRPAEEIRGKALKCRVLEQCDNGHHPDYVDGGPKSGSGLVL